MLLLTLQAAESLYAIDVARVVEVVPRINLRRLPHAPVFLAGVFDYRGIIVPVIDLGTLPRSESCRSLLSTRIILVDSRPADEQASNRPAPVAAGHHRRAGQRCRLGQAGAGDLRGHAASHGSLPWFHRRA